MIKRLPRSGKFWTGCFITWFLTLSYLSHGNKVNLPEVPFFFFIPIDKLLHFGFFFGGGGLLSAALFYGKKLPLMRLLFLVTLILSLVGIYDEYHQSFFLNRSGNDIGDWMADTLGAFCSVFVFWWSEHKLLNKDLSTKDESLSKTPSSG